MHQSTLIIPLVAQQDDPIRRHARHFSRLPRRLEEALLRDQCLGPRVFQLVSQLLGRVGRVRGARDTASPDDTQVDDDGIDVVGREEAQHVALFPPKPMLEALSKLYREVPRLGKRVGSIGVAVDEDGCA